jgi:hypothetical protein
MRRCRSSRKEDDKKFNLYLQTLRLFDAILRKIRLGNYSNVLDVPANTGTQRG